MRDLKASASRIADELANKFPKNGKLEEMSCLLTVLDLDLSYTSVAPNLLIDVQDVHLYQYLDHSLPRHRYQC